MAATFRRAVFSPVAAMIRAPLATSLRLRPIDMARIPSTSRPPTTVSWSMFEVEVGMLDLVWTVILAAAMTQTSLTWSAQRPRGLNQPPGHQWRQRFEMRHQNRRGTHGDRRPSRIPTRPSGATEPATRRRG